MQFLMDSTSHLHTLYCKRLVRLQVQVRGPLVLTRLLTPHWWHVGVLCTGGAYLESFLWAWCFVGGLVLAESFFGNSFTLDLWTSTCGHLGRMWLLNPKWWQIGTKFWMGCLLCGGTYFVLECSSTSFSFLGAFFLLQVLGNFN
jgi:hypothetical protein